MGMLPEPLAVIMILVLSFLVMAVVVGFVVAYICYRVLKKLI